MLSTIESIKAAETVYNSYLLLYKLSVVGAKQLLSEVISQAIDQEQEEINFEVCSNQYRIQLILDNDQYELQVLEKYAKPEVKHILEYTDAEVMNLLANSRVYFKKSGHFIVEIYDKTRKENLRIGGSTKKIPFAIRFANFYDVIKIIKDSSQRELRVANNIATGSGKTGDIAFLKLWAYLANIPLIVMVPNDTLKDQSYNFDKEFLPDIVADTFASPLCKLEKRRFSKSDIFDQQEKIDFESSCFRVIKNVEYDKLIYIEALILNNTKQVTATFDQALNVGYGELNKAYCTTALFCIDEAPKLTEKPVLMARAVKMLQHNPTIVLSASPDQVINEAFRIQKQILLSPKEREELGIGKLPIVHYHKTKFKDTTEMERARAQGKSEYKLLFACPEKQYVVTTENSYEKLTGWKDAVKRFKELKKNSLKNLSQPFLDCISQSIDSRAYKSCLIAVTDANYANQVIRAIMNDGLEEREQERKISFFRAIKELDVGLSDNEIRSLLEKNLNTKVGSDLLSSIKLCNIIDTFNEYQKSGREWSANEISKFIEKKYGITDDFIYIYKFNSQLAQTILDLRAIYLNSNEHRKYIERNYSGDKELHEYIFKNSTDIAEFCETAIIIYSFNEREYFFDKKNGHVVLISSDRSNVINIIKSGFVPNVISKELYQSSLISGQIINRANRLNRVFCNISNKCT